LNYIFPLRDLYKNLVEIDLDVSKVGKYRTEFKNKYPGKYSIVLLPEKAIYSEETYKINYKLNLKIISDKTFNIDFDINSKQRAFWEVKVIGRKKYESYMVILLFEYFVPRDLPRNKNIVLEMEVVKADKEFVELYGKQKLIVKKNTDPMLE
jgi:hypothetical protein